MMLPYLPSVLQASNNNSISVERALKLIQELLLEFPTSECQATNEKVEIALDDIELMLSKINRD